MTTRELTDFYRRNQDIWHASAPRQLLTSGGLTQLDWNSGIDWRSIFRLPHNDVLAIHVYSDGDRKHSVPAIAACSHELSRPWIIEEFGFPAYLGDATRAAGFVAVFDLARRQKAAGAGFWNVGRQTRDTYDVGPQFPATFHVVRTWAERDS